MNNKMYEYFKVIGEINTIVDNSKTIDEVLKRTLKLITSSFNVDDAVIWYKDDKEILHPYYSVCSLDITNKQYLPNEGVIGKVYSEQKGVKILDYKKDKQEDVDKIFEGIDIASLVVTPISNQSGKVGAVQYIKRTDSFDDDQANILEIITDLAMVKINDSEQFNQTWNKQDVLISIKDARKEFKNGEFITKVLKGINLDIYKGEFIVLLGESGCGKSTLLNAIGGMDKLNSGSIYFNNMDLTTASHNDLVEYRRNHVGFIFQSYNLMPNLNVKENVDLIAELIKDPTDTMEVLESVGLSDRAKNYPSQLSGGQQQRVSIARALVKKPTVIMADEPTAALDYETSLEVLAALENITSKGTTLIMVTHNEEIAKMANRIVRLRNGQVHDITVNLHPLHASDLVW